MNRFVGAISLAFASVTLLHGAVLTGPFALDKGHWTLVPNGDFQSGAMTDWVNCCEQIGIFRSSVAGGESSVNQAGKGSGFAVIQTVSVEPGGTYVLSGFVQTGELSGHFYLDLNDVSFEPHDDLQGGIGAAAGVAEWQFVWAAFTVPSKVTNITVRVVHDGCFQPGEHGYVDQVAVTPVCEFVPPETTDAVLKKKDTR
ncbi:MAG TPA: hypothetical protein VL171_12615 [Verrucomicrobiae bacterium]|nr:hypothetical protein [Verrucomicrobiae bacterium]